MSFAYLGDITPEAKDKAKNFGIAGAGFGFSMMCAPALTGYLIQNVTKFFNKQSSTLGSFKKKKNSSASSIRFILPPECH